MTGRWPGCALALAAAVLGAACASYQGAARPFEPQHLVEAGWTATPGVPVMRQTRELDCGPVATAMLLRYWGKRVAPDALRAEARVTPDRALAAGTIRDLVKARGLEAYLVEGEVADLQRELVAGRPVLVGLAKPISDKKAIGHYEIVAGLNQKRGLVATVDPAGGWRQYPLDGFLAEWKPTKRLTLIVGPAEDGGEEVGRGPAAIVSVPAVGGTLQGVGEVAGTVAHARAARGTGAAARR